ncbi:MAG: hypothetical protein A2Y92_05625 [Chloroflexi bacterium RBG_13_57_8]|nr:MAG: hypothetical protein A2Y92_05625 [Chloroflexi bacterium RBG_13_57_8]
MTLPKNDKPGDRPIEKPIAPDTQGETTGEKTYSGLPPIAARLEELDALPHRNPAIHWIAFSLSLLSLVILAIWVFSSHGAVASTWIAIDIGLGVLFAIEFFTRSGFRWGRFSYLRTRFFDFIAIVPALWLVNHGFVIEGVWVWLILVARLVRVVDRFFGDGFVQHTVLALVWGFEEEITDRVIERILSRVQEDMDRTSFSQGVAEAFVRNKADVLRRVRESTPKEGLVPTLAQMVGLVDALERAEERAYDAIVEILNSQEIDRAVRDVVNSMFFRMRTELGKRTWREHLRLRHRHP